MDLIVSIIIVLCFGVINCIIKPTQCTKGTLVSNSGTDVEFVVNESTLKVGKNLMLKREPRAYHKILDEMGLS